MKKNNKNLTAITAKQAETILRELRLNLYGEFSPKTLRDIAIEEHEDVAGTWFVGALVRTRAAAARFFECAKKNAEKIGAEFEICEEFGEKWHKADDGLYYVYCYISTEWAREVADREERAARKQEAAIAAALKAERALAPVAEAYWTDKQADKFTDATRGIYAIDDDTEVEGHKGFAIVFNQYGVWHYENGKVTRRA